MIPCNVLRVIADLNKGAECAVIDGNETSDWLTIRSGVKKGYRILGC